MRVWMPGKPLPLCFWAFNMGTGSALLFRSFSHFFFHIRQLNQSPKYHVWQNQNIYIW